MKNKFFRIISFSMILLGLSLFSITQVFSSEVEPNRVEVIYGVSDEDKAYELESLYQIKLISFSKYGFAVYEAHDTQLDYLEKQGFELNNTHETALPPWKQEPTNVDPYMKDQYALDLMNVHAAWLETVGSADIVIAIIDTGIDINHDEFIGRISVLSYNSRTKQVGISYVVDDNGHGTLIAGVIGAIKDNSKGIAGIVQNSKLMVIKANNLDDPTTDNDESKSFTDASIIEGIYYAADQGAHVINMSLGSSSANSLMQQAIHYARTKGVILVAASGNDGASTKFYPASFDGVISVSAVKEDGNIWELSNYNDKVDLSAPGALILSTAMNNGYATASGTSLAAPQVTGIIALMLSYFTEFDSNQIIQQLISSATDKGTVGYDVYYGHGTVNAAAALNVIYITVTLDTDGGDPIEPFLVVKDYAFSLENPIKTGYDFQGWFRDSMFSIPFNVGVDSSSVDLTLYAKFVPFVYQVDFVTAGTSVNSIFVTYGQTFELPETLRTGYNFMGWYVDNNYITAYNGSQVTENLTLYAKFSIITYDVIYYIDGAIDSSIKVDYGTTFTPMIPFSEYPFINWYLDSDFVDVYEITPVYANLNLYARFNDGKYTVTFYGSDQVTVILTTVTTYGGDVTPPSDPIKSSSPSFDYLFEGWSSVSTNIIEDTAIYPIYTKIFNDASVYLLPGIDTVSSIEDWIDGGLIENDALLSYETRIVEDSNQANRYFIYYDIYSEGVPLGTRLRIVNVKEDNPIVVTLKPDVTTIEVGSKYSDQGITTNLGLVTTTGVVNTSVAGTYMITYTITYESYTLSRIKYVYVLELDEIYSTETLYHKKEEEGWFL
ncbi:MAG: S8 family serine peptidase [Acholeplasmataceae bacterium]|nr:S8 family serine peptidase [Acholeplasmataceae bacterium]